MILVAIWAVVGVPYGIAVYRKRLAEGCSELFAVLTGIVRGICWPPEQLVKRVLIPLWQWIQSKTSS